MRHDEAFLRAVLETPDDDAPRLIYADWLEERGDPRGEFIRAQCALERLDPADPVRLELEGRARAILMRHEGEWTAPLRGDASAWVFRRGFVEEVTLSAECFANQGAALFDVLPIRKVRLQLGRETVEAAAACPWLTHVGVLDVSGCRLRDDGVERLLASPHLTRLTGLNLAGNELESAAVRTLVASPLMPRLTWLSLNGNHALGLRPARALAQAPVATGLRFLDLSHTNIGLSGLRDLLNSTFLTSLTALRAAGVGYYGVAGPLAVDLAASSVLSRLTELDLGGFPSRAGLATMLQSPVLGRLTSLRLTGGQLRDERVRMIAESPYLSGLRTLDLGHNGISSEGAKALAGSPHLSSLTSLNLGYNHIRDTGAKALAESTHLKQLTALDLGSNSIGGPGVQALAASSNLDRLTMLALGGNYVGVESVRALAASPHLAWLTHLRLEGNHLDEQAARLLAGSRILTRLSTLYLDSNDLNDGGLAALLKSPYLTRLTELSVRHNGIGKAGLDVVARLLDDSPRWPGLRKLDLRGNTLSGHEQRGLQQRFGGRVEL